MAERRRDVDRFKESFNGRVGLTVCTTVPTTGLTKGELLMIFHGDRPILGCCISDATQTVKMLTFKNGTLGRLTN